MENLCPRPDCGAVLERQSNGEFDTWVCPKSHGFAATITELWGQLQDDEIRQLWDSAKNGQPSDLLSPGLRLPMVRVEVAIDDDEERNNAPADAPFVTLDVAYEEQFIWFDVGEYEQFTRDKANPEPTPEEQKQIRQIADQFVEAWAEEVKKRNHLGAAADKFANIVDPEGKLARGFGKAMPGKSSSSHE